MRTVQVRLDDDLARKVDRAAAKLGTTRSGFTRDALKDALSKVERKEVERRHREGYEKHPVQAGEFDIWEDEQVWVD